MTPAEEAEMWTSYEAAVAADQQAHAALSAAQAAAQVAHAVAGGVDASAVYDSAAAAAQADSSASSSDAEVEDAEVVKDRKGKGKVSFSEEAPIVYSYESYNASAAAEAAQSAEDDLVREAYAAVSDEDKLMEAESVVLAAKQRAYLKAARKVQAISMAVHEAEAHE